jgi:hypothetical protein
MHSGRFQLAASHDIEGGCTPWNQELTRLATQIPYTHYGKSASSYFRSKPNDLMIGVRHRYAFPYEELDDGIIDMTEEQKAFYVNPYSGELSLKFPRAEKRCRGGILACVILHIIVG